MDEQPSGPRAVGDVLVECEERIDRPAAAVWAALQTDGDGGGPGVLSVRVGALVHMEQVADRDDRLMLLRTEMVRGVGVPWSTYRLRVRVESVDAAGSRSRVCVTCLATVTADAEIVRGMLRGLLLLGLRDLKAQVEST